MEFANAIAIASNGAGTPELALAVVRVAVGGFFAISGYHKLFHPGRHESLRRNLTKNCIPFVPIMEWWVPVWEFIAGVMLAIGLLSAFSASVLTIICIVACACEAHDKVEAYKPINTGDRVADYLYLPEVLYIVLLAVTMLGGAGPYSVDALILMGV